MFWGVGSRRFFFGRSTSVLAVQRLVQHLAGTRSVLYTSSALLWHLMRSVFLRVLGGAVNLAVTLGSNMYAGAHARSTFPTKHPSHKVSTSPHHDNQQAWAWLSPQERNVTLSFWLCAATGRDITEAYSLQEREGRKVIINHIYDAVREPT
jgi:hypothetical protein